MEQQTSLLDRINDAPVDDSVQLTAEDHEYLKPLQDDFKAFVGFVDELHGFLDEKGVVVNSWGVSYHWKTPDNIKCLADLEVKGATKHFVDRVIRHFEQAYGFDLDRIEELRDYDKDVTYDEIAKGIVRYFSQHFGGVTLTDCAIEQSKSALKEAIIRNGIQPELKNARLTIHGMRYDTLERAVFACMSHFEGGSATYLHQIGKRTENGWKPNHGQNTLRVKSVKFYKNGKCEILFSWTELAKQFAGSYLGFDL